MEFETVQKQPPKLPIELVQMWLHQGHNRVFIMAQEKGVSSSVTSIAIISEKGIQLEPMAIGVGLTTDLSNGHRIKVIS